MGLTFVAVLAVATFALFLFSALRRRALLASIAGMLFLLFGVVWMGETLGFLNV